MPYPSAPNAYPSRPYDYPSGPSVGSPVADTEASTAYTGLPPVTILADRIVVDTATATARTGSLAAGSAGDRAAPDTATATARTGILPVVVGSGVFILDVAAEPTLPSGGTLPRGNLLPARNPVVVAGSTGNPVETWQVDRADVAGTHRVGSTRETSFGATTGFTETVTASRTADAGATTIRIDRFPVDITGTARTGSTLGTTSATITDPTIGTSRTGTPGEGAPLTGQQVSDTAGMVLTGLPDAGADNELLARPAALATTGLPNDGTRPVWRIWPDVGYGARTGLPTTIYAISYIDRSGPATSLGGSPHEEQSLGGFPPDDPSLVTIFTYFYPGTDRFTPFQPGRASPLGRLAPVSPQDDPARDLRYRLYLAETRTGRIAYELPYAALTWSSKLNNIGTLSADVIVSHVYDALSDADERDPKNLFRQFLASGAFRYSLVLTYGNAVVWAGPYTPTAVPGGTSMIQMGGSDFGALLQRRILTGPNPPAASSDVWIGPTNKPYLAMELMQYATRPTADGRWDLPWAMTDIPYAIGTEYRTYFSYDLRSVWDALSSLSQELDGPDFRFDPYMYQGDDGNYVWWNMVVGRPLLATPHEWGWDAPATATVTWNTNVTNFATHYYGTGSGQDRNKLVAVSSRDKLIDLGFPGLQLTDTLHTSVINQKELQALTDGDLDTYGAPIIRWDLAVQASMPPLLGSYRVGDTVLLRVEQHPVIPDGNYHRRITSMKGTADDTVVITSSDSYVVQATSSTGVQIISSE